jgi:hypothetical protein
MQNKIIKHGIMVNRSKQSNNHLEAYSATFRRISNKTFSSASALQMYTQE